MLKTRDFLLFWGSHSVWEQKIGIVAESVKCRFRHNPNAYIKYGKCLRYYSAVSRDLLYFSILHVCSLVALS